MCQITFDFLRGKHDWLPIAGCPGRYTLAEGITPLSINDLTGMDRVVTEAVFAGARDLVFYCHFDGGGMISYKKPNGFLHTLCDEDGMRRKLAMLRGTTGN